MRPLVFDFSGEASGIPEAEVLDCTALEGCRRYCDPAAEAHLRSLIAGRFGGVHFLGSGDYHYLTLLLAEGIREPFDLLLLDHHPDMQEPAFGGVLSCGGWLRNMLEDNPFLQKVTIVGIDPALRGETFGFGDRVTVFCEGETVVSFCPREGVPLYVSIDLDVLCTCEACCNWDQGSMTMANLEAVLGLLAGGRRLLGADICGGFPVSEGAAPSDAANNSRTNLHLLEFLLPFLQ